MATYVISDIHANFLEFKALLNKINFKFDGSDTLLLLGDYEDWGPEALETLLFVMKLTKEHSFIKPLIGNHDLMFLNQIKSFKENKNDIDDNWIFANGGKQTFEAFLTLPIETQNEIEEFLENLPYRIDYEVNGKLYVLAHACPVEVFVDREDYTKDENQRAKEYRRYKAVWERITRKIPYVIQWFDEEGKYENFICGHTITKNIKDGHFSIINNEKDYIDIDCGAKILSWRDEPNSNFARLAALRLDDYKEFYQEYIERK